MPKNAENPRKGQKELTQEKLIQALLQFPTIKAAAESVGITDRTAQNYLDEPVFQQAYEKAKDSMFSEMRNGLISLASKATSGLYDLMQDTETPHATRIRAYQLALDRGLPIPVPSDQPLQGNDGLVQKHLLPYLTNEELTQIDVIIHLAEARQIEAQQLKDGAERKRQ